MNVRGGEEGYQTRGRGSKFGAFCNNVIIECPYEEINGESWCSILLIKRSFTIFSKFFEKVFKTLTDRKLLTVYLPLVCLTKGETYAIIAFSQNILLLKLYCNAILSVPVDFLLSIFLKSCSTPQAETFGRWLFQAKINVFFIFFYKDCVIMCNINHSVNCYSACSSYLSVYYSFEYFHNSCLKTLEILLSQSYVQLAH